MIVTNDYKFSSNINEVIRIILNFFIQKFHNYKKAQDAYKRAKTKNVYKKHLSSNINEVIKTIVVWVNGVVRLKPQNEKCEIS